MKDDERDLVECAGAVFNGHPYEVERAEDDGYIFFSLSPAPGNEDGLTLNLHPLYNASAWIFRPLLATRWGVEFDVVTGIIGGPRTEKKVHMLFFFEPTTKLGQDILESRPQRLSLWERLSTP